MNSDLVLYRSNLSYDGYEINSIELKSDKKKLFKIKNRFKDEIKNF